MSAEAAKAGTHAEGVVKRAEAVALKEAKDGVATEMQVLIGPEDGAPNFAMRRFVMGSGGGIPSHTNRVEHEQYVLRGRAEVTIGEKAQEVRAGNVLFIPAGAPHSYRVLEAPFEFLCVVPNAADKLQMTKK
jgi:quercetin dioxygenase-like cupin family protein